MAIVNANEAVAVAGYAIAAAHVVFTCSLALPFLYTLLLLLRTGLLLIYVLSRRDGRTWLSENLLTHGSLPICYGTHWSTDRTLDALVDVRHVPLWRTAVIGGVYMILGTGWLNLSMIQVSLRFRIALRTQRSPVLRSCQFGKWLLGRRLRCLLFELLLQVYDGSTQQLHFLFVLVLQRVEGAEMLLIYFLNDL